MSDDKQLGKVCCLPRRYFCILLGVAFLIYCVAWLVENLIFYYLLRGGTLTPKHCSGHRCYQILTCRGMQDVTWKLREIVAVGGGIVFSAMGIMGGINQKGKQAKMFSFFLLSIAVVYAFNAVADAAFTIGCQSWPYNVVDLVILWPYPLSLMNWPVSSKAREEIRLLETYSTSDIDQLTNMSVGKWYAFFVVAAVSWWLYAFRGVFTLSQYFHHGTAGLGPTFDLQIWRDRIVVKRECGDLIGHTVDMVHQSYGSALKETYHRHFGEGNQPMDGFRRFEPDFSPEPPVWKPVERGLWVNGMLPSRPLPIHRDVLAAP